MGCMARVAWRRAAEGLISIVPPSRASAPTPSCCRRPLSTGVAVAVGGASSQKNGTALQRLPRSTPAAQFEDLLRHDGALVVEAFLSPSQVDRINAELDPHIASTTPGGSLDADDDLKQFVGLKTKRLSNLVALSSTWRDEVLDDDLVHHVCDQVIARRLGDYWMNSSLLIEIGPGEKAQMLHRDAAQWWPFVFMQPATDAPIFYLNFLVALTDTTVHNGATCYVPGSHNEEWEYDVRKDDLLYGHAGAGGWANEDRPSTPVAMRAGDAMLLGDRLIHGGGANSTEHECRRVVSLSFVSSVFTPEQASPLFTDLALARRLPSRVQKLLGFRTLQPAGAPGLWSVDTGDTGKALGLDNP